MFKYIAGLIILGSICAMSHTICNEMFSNKVMTLLKICSTDIPACQAGMPLKQDSTFAMTTTSERIETSQSPRTNILTVSAKNMGTSVSTVSQQLKTENALIPSITDQTKTNATSVTTDISSKEIVKTLETNGVTTAFSTDGVMKTTSPNTNSTFAMTTASERTKTSHSPRTNILTVSAENMGTSVSTVSQQLKTEDALIQSTTDQTTIDVTSVSTDKRSKEIVKTLATNGVITAFSTDGVLKRTSPTTNTVCLSAPNVMFGESSSSDPFSINDTVVYTCINGYELDGDDTLVCRSDGSFAPSPPSCVRVCLSAPNVMFGESSSSGPFSINDTVIYTCINGYELVGDDTLVCRSDGTFAPSPPSCVREINNWVSLSNGYQYTFVTKAENWGNARATCHGMGGDLASFGIRNIETRRDLVKDLKIEEFFWIGLNDLTSEGTWNYITSYPSNDGDQASSSTALWGFSQPTASTDLNCAIVFQIDWSSYSFICSELFPFLCEKSN